MCLPGVVFPVCLFFEFLLLWLKNVFTFWELYFGQKTKLVEIIGVYGAKKYLHSFWNSALVGRTLKSQNK